MAGKSYDALNFRKTPQVQRGTYTYEFADGQRVTITPDEQGCTEIDIKRLHSIDDHEVYVNIKGSRPPLEDWQKPILEQWKKDHPDETPEKNWNMSLNTMLDADGGEDDANTGYLKGALFLRQRDWDDCHKRRRVRQLDAAAQPGQPDSQRYQRSVHHYLLQFQRRFTDRNAHMHGDAERSSLGCAFHLIRND